MLTLKMKRMQRGGRTPRLPAYQTADAAAMDIAAFIDTPVTVPARGRAIVPTGLQIELPHGYCALLLARSGLGIKKGIALSNGVGLIDADFRGEICVGISNASDEPFVISDGDRIAQMMILQVPQCQIVETNVLNETERGAGGLGSTGITSAKE